MKLIVETVTSLKPSEDRLALIASGSFHGLESAEGEVKEGKTSLMEGIQPGFVQQVKPMRPSLHSMRCISISSF